MTYLPGDHFPLLCVLQNIHLFISRDVLRKTQGTTQVRPPSASCLFNLCRRRAEERDRCKFYLWFHHRRCDNSLVLDQNGDSGIEGCSLYLYHNIASHPRQCTTDQDLSRLSHMVAQFLTPISQGPIDTGCQI